MARTLLEQLEAAIEEGLREECLSIGETEEGKGWLREWLSWLEKPASLKERTAAEDRGLYGRLCRAMEAREIPDWQGEKFHSSYGLQKLRYFSRVLVNKFTEDERLDFFFSVEYDYAYRFMTYAEKGLFELGTEREVFRQVLNDYGRIKNERNISNHARLQEEFMTAAGITTLMTDAIKRLPSPGKGW